MWILVGQTWYCIGLMFVFAGGVMWFLEVG
jgi:hypothetical protein